MDEKKVDTATFSAEKAGSQSSLERTETCNEAQVIELHDARNGQFHRSFSPRQVHIISLGSNIGSGVFIGTGKALANGGPGNMVIAVSRILPAF